MENLGFELVSDGDLELLLDNADDAKTKFSFSKAGFLLERLAFFQR